MGRICHIGIFVQPKEKGLHLSHVNRITKNHTIVPVRFPLNIPFSYSLELDISSLIPKAEAIEKVQLPSKDTPIMCSSYVGIIFLKAIHEVNIMLKQLRYREEIAHPFGEHENLMNLDILRLVYLWNHLNVVREPKVHPTISKVMSSLSTLKLIRNV